jgi:hypothetical protein
MKEAAINLSYKAYPRADARRYLTALLAVDHLKDKATIHYIGLLIGCTRAEAQRALEAAELQLGVKFERVGSRYKIVSWGVLKKAEVPRLIKSAE